MLQRQSILYIILCLFAIPNLIAQPDIEWQKTLGGSEDDIAYAIEQTPDGGYVVAGESRSSDGDVTNPLGWKDFWVVKLEAEGEIEWQNNYGGSQHDIARDISLTSDGGYIVVGQTGSEDGHVTGLQGSDDIWLIKLAENGELEWEKTLGGTGSDNGYAVKQTPDGGYFVAGYSNSTNGDVTGNHGDIDYWVVRLDSTGTIIWENSYGGSKHDLPFSLDLTSDDGCIVVGRSKSKDGDIIGSHSADNFSHDNWVIKLSSSGTLEWQRSLGGSENDVGRYVIQTSDGNFIVVGISSSSDGDVSQNNGDTDAWIVKLDQNGNIIWEKNYGYGLGDSADAIVMTKDGGYIVSGYTGHVARKDFWAIKLTQNGEIDWEKSMGGSEIEWSFGVQQTKDDGFILAGRTNSDNIDVTDHKGEYDFWVVKLGACGVNPEVEIQDDGLESLEVALSSNYQWMDCATGDLIEGQQNAYFSPLSSGEFAVIVSNGSCIDTSDCIVFCPFSEGLSYNGISTLEIEEDSPNLSIQWINCETGELIEGEIMSSFSPSENGSYAAVLNNGNCSITTECITVCPEDVYIDIAQIGDTLFALTDTIVASYQWYNCAEGTQIINNNIPYFIPDQSGEYGVMVTQDGCVSNLVCVDFLLLSADEPKESLIDIFPNPVHETLYIKSIGNDVSYDFTILNQQGVKLVTGKVQSSETEVDISQLPAGTYYLFLKNESRTTSKFFVKL